MKAWLKSHDLLTVAMLLAIGWILYRKATGKSLVHAGHASPADAISYGWAVAQAGVTGWQETSPDGSQVIMHDTGWSDPYATA